jgi:hypothetical protein
LPLKLVAVTAPLTLRAPFVAVVPMATLPLYLDRQDRKGDPAHTVDIDRRHEDMAHSAEAKVARTLNGTEAVEQRGTDQRHW